MKRENDTLADSAPFPCPTTSTTTEFLEHHIVRIVVVIHKHRTAARLLFVVFPAVAHRNCVPAMERNVVVFPVIVVSDRVWLDVRLGSKRALYASSWEGWDGKWWKMYHRSIDALVRPQTWRAVCTVEREDRRPGPEDGVTQ
jgi:hypothetical protein